MPTQRPTAAYAAGSDHALARIGLEKVAIVGTLGRGLAKGVEWLGRGRNMLGAAGATRGAVSNAIGKTTGAWGQAADKAVQTGAGKVFGERGTQFAGKYLKGMPGEVAKQTLLGAGIQGGLEAGMGAYNAEPGSRMEGALRGGAHGALSGGAFGAASGVLMNPVMNARKAHLEHIGTQRGLTGAGLESAVKAQGERGFFGSVKDVGHAGLNKVRGVEAPAASGLGWQGSLSNAIGGPAEQAAMFAPMFLLPQAVQDPDIFRPNEPTPKMASTADSSVVRAGAPVLSYAPTDVDKEPIIDPMSLATMLGASTGAATASLGAKALEHYGHLPKDSLRTVAVQNYAPILGALAGTLSGRAIGREFKYEKDKAKTKSKGKTLADHLEKKANLFRMGPGGIQKLVPEAATAAEHVLPAMSGQVERTGGLGAAHQGLFSTVPSSASAVPEIQELGVKFLGMPSAPKPPSNPLSSFKPIAPQASTLTPAPARTKSIEELAEEFTKYPMDRRAQLGSTRGVVRASSDMGPGFAPRQGGPRRQLLGSG